MLQVVQNTDQALAVMQEAGQWLHDSGKPRSDWWAPEKLAHEILGKYAKADEFYVALVDGKPAAAAILQEHESLQDWSSVDGASEPGALYIHYVAVARDFAGQGLPKVMLDFGVAEARRRGISNVRLDTNADEPKLRRIYESCGFKEVTILNEEHGRVVLYEKKL